MKSIRRWEVDGHQHLRGLYTIDVASLDGRLVATIRMTHVADDYDHVQIKIVSAPDEHRSLAFAEVLRLGAYVHEQIALAAAGEIETRLDVPLILGDMIEVSSPDAVLAIAAYFGDDFGSGNAADYIIDNCPWRRGGRS